MPEVAPTSLADRLRQRIRRDGPIGVDTYMAEANAAYYASRDPLGLGGDFVTAPEISQMFGEMVGAALADAWLRAGGPVDAAYAELGPGRGTLAADALRVMAGAGFAGPVVMVETSPLLRAAQAALIPSAVHVDAIAALPPAPLLLVANEFLDALPIRQWVGDQERRIDLDGHSFAFTAHGPVREESPDRAVAVTAIAAHLVTHGGVAVLIDYGHEGGDGDTLQAVRDHAFADVLDAPGEQDLTAHVDFAAVARSAREAGATVSRSMSQGTWLESLGIGARAMALAARNPARTDEIAIARRRLSAEDAMGRLFKVMAIAAPGWPLPAGLSA